MQDDLGKLVLRLTVGALLLLHGVHKMLTGIAPIEAMVVARHLPQALAYGVYVGEIIAPVMVMLGIFARIGAGIIVVNMVMAVVLAGMSSIAQLNPMGGYALELEAFYMLGALSIAFLGAGRFSIAGGRWN
ncbi:MAG TPA: DoxX family protein [Rhizomicrobium sp.]|nr:DoxX family protein [Rhizomicrobium sp.]